MIIVVIPCYKVKDQILNVIKEVPKEVDHIIAVDDCCPDGSGKFIQENCQDPRIEVLFHEKNQGVGGALISGYKHALQYGRSVIVKLDGDGQMDPKFIPTLIAPILKSRADYTKGNRFYFIREITTMPKVRIFGNASLSFINKVVTGYWNVMDPTNGYTAISSQCLELIPLDRIARNYFFESDMLFRLSTINAVVRDVPMLPKYEDEQSNLSVINTLRTFPKLYFIRLLKRILYKYYIRDFNLGSIFLIFGIILLSFGTIFGIYHWCDSVSKGISTPTGTVMISAIGIILGFQSSIFFLQSDISTIPTIPLSDFEE